MDCITILAGLPPHQEIGMPSLSPTMSEVNFDVTSGSPMLALDFVVVCNLL